MAVGALAILAGCTNSRSAAEHGQPVSSPASAPSRLGMNVSVTPTPTLPPGYIRADGQGPPARPCAVARRGQEISFRVEPDTPQPPCWKVREFRSVRIVNATGDYRQRPRLVTGRLTGVGRFRLEPGHSRLLRLPLGKYFASGDHCISVSQYPGSCLDVWVVPKTR